MSAAAMTVDVTVVIPCFNCAETVGRAVASVAAQTQPPRQVVMVDDGSRDQTPDVLLDLQRSYSPDWLYLCRLKTNAGPAVARNVGWDAATCSLVAFLDSDDAWHPDKLSQQVSVMNAHRGLGFCGHRWCRSSGAPWEWVRVPVNKGKVRIVSATELLFINRFVTSSVMVRRQLPFRFNQKLRYAQDYALWLEMLLAGTCGGLMSAKLVVYFKHLYGHSGQTRNLKNHHKAAREIYSSLNVSGQISTPLRRVLDVSEFIKYQRRRSIVSWRAMHAKWLQGAE